MDLFSLAEEKNTKRKPLAVRMRPQKLSELAGQEHLLSPDSFLRRMIQADTLPSLVLYGPSGTGKTTLAELIATTTGAVFERLNAVTAGTADLRKELAAAQERRQLYGKATILFVDEVHRFNKAQQDVLLPYVEDGRITLIGATTENPYFEINGPLLSRMRVLRLKPLTPQQLEALLKRALEDKERGLGKRHLQAEASLWSGITGLAGGDARTALNLLEQCAAMVEDEATLNLAVLEKVADEKLQRFDKNGDAHYDTVSAFIKSMRGSDPDAAVHYLARLLAAGEDLQFIARRIVICAAEDVGNADPRALVLAMAAAEAARFVGLPEARIPLAQAVVYIATAPKSNASYLAIDAALGDVRHQECGSVPLHLRDAHYRGAAHFGHGAEYRYSHDFPGHWVDQEYLPEPLQGRRYYEAALGPEKTRWDETKRRQGRAEGTGTRVTE
ncbi:MAG: replication-associated recombination protein A [Anaeromusa sp.]|uniref:replication-associated recombination protein A n=1 Tax=Anaeromusa sp. TaxID=1872520 RepID=UPI002B2084C7|nr:replication-associated recombination protein A [Anaeromusa sp.]MEA4834823.1 replication-associated recombination protein A [Anaeromusa sp.]